MNKIILSRVFNKPFIFLLTLSVILVQSACKKDGAGNGPVITSVRNYAASPNDTLVTSVTTGQWVVLVGHNLKDAIQIAFNGVPATINSVMFSDTSAAVQVPSVIPFPSVSEEDRNTIRFTTQRGVTVYKFNINAPAPVITGISNENANQGDSVYIYGSNLFYIEKITFAGSPVTAYAASADGASIGFILPSLTHSGPVVVTTQSGTVSTAYNVNDVSTGMLCNFDNINTFSWGATMDNSSAKFPGNRGYYAVLSNGILPAGDGSWWNAQRSINTNSVQWVPADSLKVPIDQYALKFEINVPDAWNGTSMYIIKDYSFDLMARYEPWLDATGTAFAYTTKGWRTVTIPLSLFRKENGKGVAAASLQELLGSTGAGAINIQTQNFSSLPTASGLTAAIDNIRIVKIK